MTRSITRSAIAAFAVLTTVVSLSTSARPPHDMDRAPDPARMVERMSDQLDLSDDQAVQIESILENSMSASRDDHERLQELRSELKSGGGDFDAGEAQEAADEIGQITSRLAYRRANTNASIYEVLNDDQREAFEAFQSSREKRGGKSRDYGQRNFR